MIDLNKESLFVERLKKTSDFSIITVSRVDHKLTHTRTTRILIKDNKSEKYSLNIIHNMKYNY